jgi:hypothetical protein
VVECCGDERLRGTMLKQRVRKEVLTIWLFESLWRMFLVAELSKLSSRRKCRAVEFVEVELSVDRRNVS